MKADALAKAVLAGARNWPAQEKTLIGSMKQNGLSLPGIVLAALILDHVPEDQSPNAVRGEVSDLRQIRRLDSIRLLSDALAAVCQVEEMANAAVALAIGEAAKKIHAAAVEAREALQDHLDALRL
jgi:hypothetical protein